MKKVVIVDKNDNVIGSKDLRVALREGLIRRISRVFLFDKDGRFYLQKRSPDMDTFPNCWDQAAGGHVDVGESYEQAARRELHEELGLKIDKIKKVTKFYLEQPVNGKITKEFSTLYTAKYSGESIKLDPKEVTEGKWVSIKELKEMIKRDPKGFTDGLIYTFQMYLKESKENV